MFKNLNSTFVKALQQQIGMEYHNAMIYKAMSSYCDSQNYVGFTKYFAKAGTDELGHGNIIINFINDMNGHAIIPGIPEPQNNFLSVAQCFEQNAKVEAETTAQIKKLYRLAMDEEDYQGMEMLHALLREQVEEESTAKIWNDRMKRCAGDELALYYFDKIAGESI